MTIPSLIPVRRIHIGKLFIDISYQRVPDPRRVNRIVANFDAHAFQVLEVSARERGRFAVFDGGHKLSAARVIGFKYLYCRVHSGLSVEDEATYFNMLQTERKRLTPIEMFHADVIRKYEPALRIQSVVDSEGFRLDERANGGSLPFIKGLYRADTLGVLRLQLRVIRDAWGILTGNQAVKQQTFMRLTSMIASIPQPVNEPALVTMLDKNQYAGCPTYSSAKSLMNQYLECCAASDSEVRIAA